MKKILFIAVADLNKKDGGGLGQKAYYNSFECLFPGQVDLIMPEEYLSNKYPKAIGVPARSYLSIILSGSIHRYRKFLKKYLKKKHNEYSLCVISGGLYAGDMMDMIHKFGLKILIIHVNYEPEYQMDNKSILTLKGRTSLLVKLNERKAYLKSDCNCFMSQEDKALFESNYGGVNTPSVIVGAYETDNVHVETNIGFPNSKILSITGSMNTVQTILGIMDLKGKYFKIVTKMLKNWSVIIAGRNPDNKIYDFAHENPTFIKIVPNPVDMNEIIQSSSIFCCPTHVGGGIKLRVMDGLRNGRPILVHKVSARGYDSLFGKAYFKVYSDEDSFKQGLSDLLAYIPSCNPSEIISEYLQFFSFEAGTNRFKKAINSIFKNDNKK